MARVSIARIKSINKKKQAGSKTTQHNSHKYYPLYGNMHLTWESKSQVACWLGGWPCTHIICDILGPTIYAQNAPHLEQTFAACFLCVDLSTTLRTISFSS